MVQQTLTSETVVKSSDDGADKKIVTSIITVLVIIKATEVIHIIKVTI